VATPVVRAAIRAESRKPHARRSTPGSAGRAVSTRSSISTPRPATLRDRLVSQPRRTAATTCTRDPKGTRSWPRWSTWSCSGS